MIVLGILYCVQLLFWGENVSNYVSLSNAIVFVSYFLGSILLDSFLFLLVFGFDVFISFFWKSWQYSFSKIYDAFWKSYWNIAPKQFFKGVVHEPAWSSTVWLFQGSSIVSKPFLRFKKKHVLLSFLFCFSFCFWLFHFILLLFLIISFHVFFFFNILTFWNDAFWKSYWNIAPKQFFKGVVHEPAWSSIVWLFQGSSIVSKPFLR